MVTVPLRGDIVPGVWMFVWGAIREGCNIGSFGFGAHENNGVSQVWFLRKDGQRLRPVVDAGGVYYLSFKGQWNPTMTRDVERALGNILLDPKRMNMSVHEFTLSFAARAHTACWIMGMGACRLVIESLISNSDSDELQIAARNFLSANPQP